MSAGFAIGRAALSPCRPAAAELLAGLRAALRAAPRPEPDIAGVPLAGGLVGYAAYDVVRYFERLPVRAGRASGVPALHYVAPRSVLVFDHLTRGIALRARRRRRRSGVRCARKWCARCAARCRNGRRAGRYAPPAAAWSPADYMAGVRRTQEYIAAGDVYQLVLASRFSGPA